MLLILESLHDLSIPQYQEFHWTQDIRCLGSCKILSAHSKGPGSLCQLRISRASDGFGDLPRLAGTDRYSSTSVQFGGASGIVHVWEQRKPELVTSKGSIVSPSQGLEHLLRVYACAARPHMFRHTKYRHTRTPIMSS